MSPGNPFARLTPTSLIPVQPRWALLALLLALVVVMLDHSKHVPVALAAAPFPQVWTAWRDDLAERGRQPSTISQYRVRLNNWRYWLWQPPRGRHRKDWWQATQDDLRMFLRRPCQPGQRNAGRPLGQTTKSVYSTTIPALYGFAYARGLIDHNPMAGWRPLRRAEPAEQPLDQGDIDRLLEHAHQHPDRRLELLVGLCYYEVLRSGEPTHLVIGDVDLAASTPRIRVLGKARATKQWLAVHAEFAPMLRRYLAWLAEQYQVGHWRELPAGTPLIQHAQRLGVPISARRAGILLIRAMRELEIPGRPHDLRRTAANEVGEAFQDNPGPLRAVLRHRGYGALDAYRRPSVGKVGEYLAAIGQPQPPAVEPPPAARSHVSRSLARQRQQRRRGQHRIHRGFKGGGAAS